MTTARAFPGFESPAAGFDEPFDMLNACHDRVRRTLQLLARLRSHLHEHGLDEMAQRAAADVHRYFALAAPLHHQDEELHVVPLLHSSGEPRLAAVAERVLADHEQMRRVWATLAPLLTQVAQGTGPDASAFGSATAEFIRLYESHLTVEEEIAFPAAQALQTRRGAAALSEMGREMARRRSIERR